MQVLSRRNFSNRKHIGLSDFEYPVKPFDILEKPLPEKLKIALSPQLAGVQTDWRIVRAIEKFAKRLARVGVRCKNEYSCELIRISGCMYF